MKIRLFIVLTFLSAFYVWSFAQFEDTIISPKVKSVKIFLDSLQLSYPILKLNSEDQIQLHFDILQDQAVALQYSFVHCNWDWTEQDLDQSECIDGYYINDVTHYAYSFNTNVGYVHYQIVFPDENVKFLVSGNYLIKVFLASNPDSVILQKRFFVVEDLVSIKADVRKASIASLRLTHQEVDFDVDLTNLNLNNPWGYVKASIYQNLRFDMVRYLQQPKFYQGKLFIYDYDYENLFPGGNEFRSFNSSDFKYRSGRIYKSAFVDSIYFCYLLPDNILYTHSSYIDFNGNFIISADDVANSWTQADYVYVNFTLLADEPFPDGDVYVFGALSNWKVRPEFKLTYDFGKKIYTGNILLKQGRYDYQYIFVPRDGTPTTQLTEGNFYQTLNYYLIFIYYIEQAPYYSRIIGWQKVFQFPH